MQSHLPQVPNNTGHGAARTETRASAKGREFSGERMGLGVRQTQAHADALLLGNVILRDYSTFLSLSYLICKMATIMAAS